MQSFGGFSALAEAMNGAADGKSARVSERKRRNCAFVYGGDIRSHEMQRMGTPLQAVAAATNSRIAEQHTRNPLVSSQRAADCSATPMIRIIS